MECWHHLQWAVSPFFQDVHSDLGYLAFLSDPEEQVTVRRHLHYRKKMDINSVQLSREILSNNTSLLLLTRDWDHKCFKTVHWINKSNGYVIILSWYVLLIMWHFPLLVIRKKDNTGPFLLYSLGCCSKDCCDNDITDGPISPLFPFSPVGPATPCEKQDPASMIVHAKHLSWYKSARYWTQNKNRISQINSAPNIKIN